MGLGGTRWSSWARSAVAVALGGVAACKAPLAGRALLEREAAPLFAGNVEAERAVALGAATWGTVDAGDFATGAELFDREWAFGTPMMRSLCLAQVTLRHPELEGELGPLLDAATRELTAPTARAFSRSKWGSDPLDPDAREHDHAAYLGYAGFALGHARLSRGSAAAPADAIAAAIRARLDRAGGSWPETYPGEVYPVDVASLAGALALDARRRGVAPGRDEHVAWLVERVRGAVDPRTGLLRQSVDPTGAELDGPRGSGTFLAAVFLHPADPGLARSLYDAGRRALYGETWSFAAMRERPVGDPGRGDVDSGPIVLGYGVSATGFALGPARAFEDEAAFRALSATAALFGAPVATARGGVSRVTGGPLGDAILCAMQTAGTTAELDRWLGGPS